MNLREEEEHTDKHLMPGSVVALANRYMAPALVVRARDCEDNGRFVVVSLLTAGGRLEEVRCLRRGSFTILPWDSAD